MSERTGYVAEQLRFMATTSEYALIDGVVPWVVASVEDGRI
jgi:hypothetical protein